MNSRSRQDFLLLGFLTCSLLLHLLLLYLLPQREWLLEPMRRQPVVVEMRPPQPPPKPRQRELDQPARPETQTPREKPARRLGPSDTTVRRESAPKGDAPEDRRPDAPLPHAAPKPAPVVPSPAPPPAQRRGILREPVPAYPDLPMENSLSTETEAGKRTSPDTVVPPEAPDLKSLLQLPEATVARLDEQWRRKYRPDVERGDAVWLDTEKDLLISFFQRLRSNIYGVWNYPARARERGEEGTCLLKITVNRDGSLDKVQLMESSGSSALDEEAMAAVRKGSPFGALPRSYEQDNLSIYAFFQYQLMRSVIY